MVKHDRGEHVTHSTARRWLLWVRELRNIIYPFTTKVTPAQIADRCATYKEFVFGWFIRFTFAFFVQRRNVKIIEYANNCVWFMRRSLPVIHWFRMSIVYINMKGNYSKDSLFVFIFNRRPQTVWRLSDNTEILQSLENITAIRSPVTWSNDMHVQPWVYTATGWGGWCLYGWVSNGFLLRLSEVLTNKYFI